MPRLYAPNEAHNMVWGHVDFIKGVSALAAGADTSFWSDEGYTIDASKHATTILDELTPSQLRSLCGYLGITIDQGEDPDSKYALVRAIESSLSGNYITELTIASTAGATECTSDIAITSPGDYSYKVKTGKTSAPTLLYMDVPDDTWEDVATGDDIEPGAADHDKVTVVRLNDDGYVIGLGSDDLTLNAG